eukprot:8970782-Ditylum_brightwellii.AAC.1
MDISNLEAHFTGLSDIDCGDSDSDPEIEIEEIEIREIEEAMMTLNADQVAAIAAAAINAAGLGTTAETSSENPFMSNINPGTKNGSALFNAATPAISNNKHIDLSMKNSQKILDVLEDLNVRYQWLQLTKSVPNGPSGGADAPMN